MLVAHGNKALQSASLRWSIALGRRAWFKLVACPGLAFDTRFIPAAPGAAKPNVCLIVQTRGQFHFHGEPARTVRAPVAVPMTLEDLEGAENRRRFTFRSDDDPAVIEVHLSVADVIGWPPPGPVDLGEAAYDAARRAHSASEARNDDALVAALGDLVRRLAEEGRVRADAADAMTAEAVSAFSRMWAATRPFVERFALSVTMENLVSSSGLSNHQVERAFQSMFSSLGIIGGGLRSLSYHLRLKAAVLFLSMPHARIGDIAELVGYKSVDAMGRAFRDAGLPTPREVQRALKVSASDSAAPPAS